MDKRIEDAEVQITHLHRTVEELSDQVARQSHELDRLKARFQMLVERLSKSDSGGEDSEVPLLEQRPPHY